ncbi:laccase-14-like isoform X1 [Nymphaea colorata]|nr:laccase-14-like isoform X1 [Nymphaea colorata]
MDSHRAILPLQLLFCLVCCSLASQADCSTTHYHDFVVAPTNYTRLCSSKNILTINGKFPGPTLYVNKGDRLIVNVVNLAPWPLTIHWHGLLNPGNPWSDGPEYITMCGIPAGTNFTHDLHLSEEEGTIWYHAHSDWTRWTVHGAVVVYPKVGAAYPFPKPDKEYEVVISEWWKIDVMAMLHEKILTGADFNKSDAFTINGQPGDQHNCSEEGMTRFAFEHGKTYLLRLVNGAMATGHFFGIANHTLRVVGRDGSYLKPFDTDFVVISPGQTMDILVQANQTEGLYYIGLNPYIAVNETLYYDITVTTALVEYEGSNTTSQTSIPFPDLPGVLDTTAAYDFVVQERSLASEEHPIDVPMEVDSRFLFTVSMNLQRCPNDSCKAILGTRFSASMNNVSFANPSIDVLDAYYQHFQGVYTTDFPSYPPYLYNFTDDDLPDSLRYPEIGTRVKVLNYNETVEIVYQGTAVLQAINHPMHLHGYDFYVVGRGLGNFDPDKDPLNYNLVDPPRENTVGVPYGGWAALRFRANNPGVWLLHCHFERHFTWGMATVFIVKNGPTNETSMLPPPPYMPKCSDAEIIDNSGGYDPSDQ